MICLTLQKMAEREVGSLYRDYQVSQKDSQSVRADSLFYLLPEADQVFLSHLLVCHLSGHKVKKHAKCVKCIYRICFSNHFTTNLFHCNGNSKHSEFSTPNYPTVMQCIDENGTNCTCIYSALCKKVKLVEMEAVGTSPYV